MLLERKNYSAEYFATKATIFSPNSVEKATKSSDRPILAELRFNEEGQTRNTRKY